jgi:aminoglycoside phosphotransferase (APT) family kinase protein
MSIEDRREALEDYLRKQLDLADDVHITNIDRMAMGQSRAMYRVELQNRTGGENRTVVVRVEQWGLLGTNSHEEVQIMRGLHGAGLPVAEILAYEPGAELLGQPFFVMEFVEGSSFFSRASLDEYTKMLDDLHRRSPESVGLGFLEQPKRPQDAALLQVERWYGVYRGGLVGEPSPLIEEAAQWLRNHAPESTRIGVVHGDPGPGNYLHSNDRVSCLVDWEFTHIGDPDEDWTYIMTMRGMGVMTEEDWIAYYRDQIGVVLEADRLRYWKALNFFKAVCIDQTAIRSYVSGDNLAPNMLAIGTAVQLSALKRLTDTIF